MVAIRWLIGIFGSANGSAATAADAVVDDVATGSAVWYGLDTELLSLLFSEGSSGMGGGDGVTDSSMIFEKFGLMHGLFS